MRQLLGQMLKFSIDAYILSISVHDSQEATLTNSPQTLSQRRQNSAESLEFVAMQSQHAENQADFAQRLRGLRRQKNLSQTQLAELAEVHSTHISRYERGLSRPTADTLRRLADCLGVTGDYLMEGTPDQAAKARFEDRELLRRFQEVQKLPDRDKEIVKELLDAFLTRRQVQSIAAR